MSYCFSLYSIYFIWVNVAWYIYYYRVAFWLYHPAVSPLLVTLTSVYSRIEWAQRLFLRNSALTSDHDAAQFVIYDPLSPRTCIEGCVLYFARTFLIVLE